MKMLIMFLLCGVCMSYAQEVSYSLASLAAQQGEWDTAQKRMQQLLIHNSERPDLLYDAGVVAARLEDYKQAQHYFEMVTEDAGADKCLQERARFNAGNMAVEQKEYQKAIEHYQAVLSQNSHHEHAQHNLEKVKGLLKKKDEDQNKSDQKKEDNQRDNSKRENQDQSLQQPGSQSHNSENQPSTEKTEQEDHQQKGSGMNDDQQDGQAENVPDNQGKTQQGKDGQKDKGQPQHKDYSTPQKKNSKQSSLAQDKKEGGKKQEKKNNGTERVEESPESSGKKQFINQALAEIEKHDGNVQKEFGRHKIQRMLGGTRYEEGW